MLWASVAGFFSDLADFFSGKAFFELAGYTWNDLMLFASKLLTRDPTADDYAAIWQHIENIYNIVNVIAAALMILFFVYGFCRDSIDLHIEMTWERTIKQFIRLAIVINLVEFALSWMPKFLGYGQVLTSAILGEKKFGFYFDGIKVYDSITDASGWGALVAFLTSMLFFIFTAVCGFMVVFTVLNRILRIYMIAPFAGMALSTLAAGGQTAQIGYSYIKSFFGYVLSAALIAVVIVISSSFIDTVAIGSGSAIVTLLEYCLKMGAIASAVKGTDAVMQKAFGM